MIKQILNLVSKHWKTVLLTVAGLFLLYWIIFIFTPSTGKEVERKIDLLNEGIKKIESQQDSLQNKIDIFETEVKKIDDKIGEIKGQKTIIKEIYHEKISSINNYSDEQLDSFFSARYSGYYTR